MTILENTRPGVQNPAENDQKALWWKRLKKRFSFSMTMILLVLNVFLVYILFKTVTCNQGLLGCGLSGFGVIFPIYLPIMDFLGHLNWVSYICLFLVAQVSYSFIIYKVVSFLERRLTRLKIPRQKVIFLPTSGKIPAESFSLRTLSSR